MRAHQIMTKTVITVTSKTSIADAAHLMLSNHISGLPVVDNGAIVGIISESDFLRRSETGTGRKRAAWLQFLLGPDRTAADFVRERGRRVEDIMTANPITVEEDTPLEDLVHLMEKKNIKRLPVLRGAAMIGIVTRSNLLQAVADLAREIPDPTSDDDHIRERIIREVNAADWCPMGFEVTVRKGIAHLHGIITTDHARQATIVAAENTSGIREVHDHLCFVDTYSGFYVESPEDSIPHEVKRADKMHV